MWKREEKLARRSFFVVANLAGARRVKVRLICSGFRNLKRKVYSCIILHKVFIFGLYCISLSSVMLQYNLLISLLSIIGLLRMRVFVVASLIGARRM
jgi:hypothetical protein